MSDFGAILRWLLALELLGWGLYPLLHRATPGLRDRGLTLAKPFALLLGVYPVWFIASLGLPLFTPPVLIAAGLLLTLGGWGLALRRHATVEIAGAAGATVAGEDAAARPAPLPLAAFLRGSWRYVALSEALFIGGFLFYVWLRSYNPQILGTEKPMEIGFLSAATRDTTLPPRDPWLSGHGINYYYLGFVLIAALAKVTAIPPSLAFNLGLATVFAMALSGGTGVMANLVAVARDGGPRASRTPRASTLAIGLLGGYLLVFAGNMYAARDVLTQGRTAIDTWWWGGLGWKSSRVVIDSGFPAAIFGPNAEPSPTITEFPFFSFILGDLHAHVLALPFTLLALALALDIFFAPLFASRAGVAPGWRARAPSPGDVARLALAALVIGGLYALNSWDLPTYAAIYLAAGALPLLAAGRAPGRHEWLAAASFALGCFVLYLPFHAHFTSLVGGQPFELPEPLAAIPLLSKLSTILGVVIWGKTPADQFFTVYLLPWVAGLLFLTWRWHEGRKGDMASGYVRPLLIVLALALVATIVRMPVLFLAGVILLLAGAIYRQRRVARGGAPDLADADLFALGLFAAAFALVLLTEVFFIHDIFGNRMNTIFKVYYQAWTLLAIGGGYAIVRVLSFRPHRRAARWRLPASAALTLLVLATLAYPIFGARARTEGFKEPGGLDGLDFVRAAQPEEWRGITWVRDNVPAGTVVAEAPGCSYGEFDGMPHDRVSTFAGVSTPLGWGGHEAQWRGGSPALVAALGPRGEEINRLYNTTDPAEAAAIIERYAIEYVYVGLFERVGYGAGGIGADCRAGGGYDRAGLAKFDALLDRAFATPGDAVVIYKRR